jgi:hypothetical protein
LKITRKLLLDMDRQLKLTAHGDITVTSFRLTRQQREELGKLADALALESDFRVTPSLVIRTLIYLALREFNPAVLSAEKIPESIQSEEVPLDTEGYLPEILDTGLEPDLESVVHTQEEALPWGEQEDLPQEHDTFFKKMLAASLDPEGLEILSRINSSED